MELKVKLIDISTESAQVVLINSHTAHRYDLHSGDRIIIGSGTAQAVATINMTNKQSMISDDQIGLFNETTRALGAREGDTVTVITEPRAESVHYVHRKLDGKELTASELFEITKDIVARNLTDIELTYFVAACSIRPLTTQETVSLAKAMVDTGTVMRFDKTIVVDKHCIGGVPGNRTSMITIPIMASLGLTIPKTSSRAVTSPAGTADTMEALANVNLDAGQVKQVVESVGACIVWGGSVNIAPADDRLIRMMRPLSIDVTELMIASVMAKKYGVGSTHVLIDIPYGKNAKVETLGEANALRDKFMDVGRALGLKLLVITTDGSQPIGYGVGPLLEAYDVIAVLKNDHSAPPDLREKALDLAGQMLEFVGRAPQGKGKEMARMELDSGRAYTKFQQIIDAQGRKPLPALGKFKKDITAARPGKITDVNNHRIARIARVAGAPVSQNAGLLVYHKKGTMIHKDERLFTIFAESEEKLQQAVGYAQTNEPYEIR